MQKAMANQANSALTGLWKTRGMTICLATLGTLWCCCMARSGCTLSGLAVPPSKAANKGVQLSAPPEERGRAAAAVLQGLPGARRSVIHAQALESIRLRCCPVS